MASTSVYQINKGINTSIEFKGLKAQYIWYHGRAAIVLFVVLYAPVRHAGNPFLPLRWHCDCLGIPMIMGIYHLSISLW